MKKWSKKAFENESAWSFEHHQRNIFFSNDREIAWFDELLNTWMGTCRGSGVMKKIHGEWKLAHYHLSLTVPNEKMEAYLKL